MKRFFANLVLDFDAHRYWRDDREVELQPAHADLLKLLIAKRGMVLSRDDLLAGIKKQARSPNTVDKIVSRIEKQLGECITTVRGKGYRWDLAESDQSPTPSAEGSDRAQLTADSRADRLRLIEARLASTMTEPDSGRVREVLTAVVREVLALIGGRFEEARCAVVASTAYGELARLATTAPERLRHRRAAIDVCRRARGLAKSPGLVARWADAVVDHFYDRTAREERTLMQGALAAAEDAVRTAIAAASAEDPIERATLLSQLASLRGCKVLMAGASDRERRAFDAVQPARRATLEAPEHPGASLALGQALHAWARYANSELAYFDRVKQAEVELRRCLRNSSPLSSLVLARFLRQSNRPTASLRCFERYEQLDPNRRRVLSEAHIAGEAALLLRYQRPKEELTGYYLQYSRDLLREAIDWGLEEARLFVALASLEAALGNLPGSQLTIARLRRNAADTSTHGWLEVIRDARRAVADGRHELLSEAFYLGLDDPMVWNALGTYAKRFIGDQSLSKSCYETALVRDPGNPYALTNLARSHLDEGESASVVEARRCIEKASRRADWSFVWWRPVAMTIEDLLDRRIEWPTRAPTDSGEVTFFRIRDRLDDLVEGASAADREACFADILHDLFRLSYCRVVSPPRGPGSPLQIEWNDQVWAVVGVCARKECGLEAIGPVLEFDDAPASGVIVASLVPFTSDVTGVATASAGRRRLVLLDESDVARILDGEQRIEELLEGRLA